MSKAEKAAAEMARLIGRMHPQAAGRPVVMLYAAVENGDCCGGRGVHKVVAPEDRIPVAIELQKLADEYVEALIDDLPRERRECVKAHIEARLRGPTWRIGGFDVVLKHEVTG